MYVVSPSIISLSQKRKEQYRKWEEFKALQRDEKHAYLQQRIGLQRELIRVRDELFAIHLRETSQKLEEVSTRNMITLEFTFYSTKKLIKCARKVSR